MLSEMLAFLLITISPFTELRMGILFGLSVGIPLEIVLPLAIIANSIIFFPIYFGLELFYDRLFLRFRWFRNLINKIHKKGSPYISKYGLLGLTVFVGTPLPVTGVWTGTAVAWLLGIDWRRSFLAVLAGVLIASSIITSVTIGLIAGISFIIK